MSTELHDLHFGVRRSVRYHRRREAFFDALRSWIQFITTFAGTATVAVVLAQCPRKLEAFMALLVAALTTLDQVLRTARKARLHAQLADRFCALERKIVLERSTAENHLEQLTAERLEIEQDEPPIKRVLDVMCHNELCKAMGYDESMLSPLTGPQRVLAQFFDWRSSHIQSP